MFYHFHVNFISSNSDVDDKLGRICVQNTVSLELLVSLVSQWCLRSREVVRDRGATDVQLSIMRIVNELTKDTITFLQVCETHSSLIYSSLNSASVGVSLLILKILIIIIIIWGHPSKTS